MRRSRPPRHRLSPTRSAREQIRRDRRLADERAGQRDGARVERPSSGRARTDAVATDDKLFSRGMDDDSDSSWKTLATRPPTSILRRRLVLRRKLITDQIVQPLRESTVLFYALSKFCDLSNFCSALPECSRYSKSRLAAGWTRTIIWCGDSSYKRCCILAAQLDDPLSPRCCCGTVLTRTRRWRGFYAVAHGG